MRKGTLTQVVATRVVIASLLLLATSRDIHAQERTAPAPGRWLPRAVRSNSNLTPAQFAEVRAFFDKGTWKRRSPPAF